ncbi:thermonuclease family protein [Aneurinibacillus sp. REN35]|uniref:thermonuclease family protein n=1 Tax=Aneurinibacillus sp. REN35 TaxID=3237286 RepID=UPI0035273D7A
MKKKISGLLVLILLSIGILSACGSALEKKETESKALVDVTGKKLQKATVVRVVDGDTFVAKVKGAEHKVRLILIDTPESKAPNRPKGYLGDEAKQYAIERLEGKDIWLEKDVQGNDRYGRWLRYAYIDVADGKGEFFNGTLVRSGLARLATFPPNVKYVDMIRTWQQEARKAERGVWNNIKEAFPDRKIEQ